MAQLDLFHHQLARFGPQIVPIVAAYQASFTAADALRMAGQTVRAATDRITGGSRQWGRRRSLRRSVG
jgi:hypothetical protein